MRPVSLPNRYNADFSKYEPLIVAHKTNPKLLFCTLTRKELNRIPKQVGAHVNGKRFKNRKAEMEGLKQAERQPMKEESEEEGGEGEEEEEDDADFWVREMPGSEGSVVGHTGDTRTFLSCICRVAAVPT